MICAKVQSGKKKGQKGAVTKKKNNAKNKNAAQRKSGKKGGQSYSGNDLVTKLLATMEKHRDVRETSHTFFKNFIYLHIKKFNILAVVIPIGFCSFLGVLCHTPSLGSDGRRPASDKGSGSDDQ